MSARPLLGRHGREGSIRLALALLLFLPATIAASNNWPRFRGPHGLGTVEGANPPERWSATENVVWKTQVPGVGWSSPVVWGDRIFLTSVINTGQAEPPKKGLYFGGERPASTTEHRWMLYAVELKTGAIAWSHEAHRGIPAFPRHLKNSYASETPVTDGERVCAYFGNVGIFCYDLKGRLLWSQRIGPFEMRNGWGTASSPVLHQGRLYVVNDNEEESFLMALDARTGRTLWRVTRDEGSNWATPFVWTHAGRSEIVTAGTRRVRSYALDGRLLWELAGMSSIVIPTPFSRHGLLYVTSGYVGDQRRPVFAVRPGATGDISLVPGQTSSAYVAWHLPQGGPYNTSPLVYGDYYYTLYDRGFLTCHDARSGKEIYGKQRLDPAAGAFTASPWAYNGKLFALSEDGETFVVQAGPEYRLLGRNRLDEFTMATPAIVGDSLILRTATTLYRIGAPAGARSTP